MPFKKYVASKDTTITNAYRLDLINRATDANMGASDSLEMFSIYGQANSSSVEKSRILVQFPTTDIIADRNLSRIPSSGSVKFFLRMFNVEHPFSVPRDYTASVAALSQSWDEGYGLDMESYTDKGWSAQMVGAGATWIYSVSGTLWSTQGGSFLTSSDYNFNVPFSSGLEDIELDVTKVVEDWMAGTISDNGFIIKLSGAFEQGDQFRSFYTKKFSARGSQFFYKRPIIEARWEAVVKDDRNQFFASSSLLNAEDNTMNLYFYNKVGGVSKNIVGNILPGVKFYSNSSLTNEVSSAYLSVTNPSVGVYKASVAINTTASVLYDKWYNTSSSGTIFSSSFDVLQRENYDYEYAPEYIININNLKVTYNENESARFKIFVREKDWQPTIYTVAYNTVENSVITDLYYKIFRLNDNYTVVDYSTGSLAYTKTSYDSNGNYFDLDMKNIEKGYVYGIKLARWNGLELKEFQNVFKFKVE
jgi:hypothetical protein